VSYRAVYQIRKRITGKSEVIGVSCIVSGWPTI
jgi:hypothetical protein